MCPGRRVSLKSVSIALGRYNLRVGVSPAASASANATIPVVRPPRAGRAGLERLSKPLRHGLKTASRNKIAKFSVLKPVTGYSDRCNLLDDLLFVAHSLISASGFPAASAFM